MTIYDISVPIGKMTPVYEGDPPVKVAPMSSIAAGDKMNISLLSFSSHTGTHIDAPHHFNEQGKKIDELPLELFIGQARVVEVCAENGYITRYALEKATNDENIKRLLIKTGNSKLWRQSGFVRDYAALTADAAKWIVEAGIKLVGIDYLSIERFGSTDSIVHRTLLDNSVVILEGLDLSVVPPGSYELFCAPLKIKNGDGAPARAVLISNG